MRLQIGLILSLCILLQGCSIVKSVFGSKSSSSEQTKNTLNLNLKDNFHDSTFQIRSTSIDYRRIARVEIERNGSLTISPGGEMHFSGDGIRAGFIERKNERDSVQNITTATSSSSTTTESVDKSKSQKSEETKEKEVTRKPSFTPYIGIGLTIGIVIFSVLYFLRKKIQFPTFK